MCHRLRSVRFATLGTVVFRYAPPPDPSLLHFTLLHQRYRRVACCRIMLLRIAPLHQQAPKTPLTGLPLARKSDVCCPVLAISVYRGYLKRDSSKGVCCSAGLRSVFGGSAALGACVWRLCGSGRRTTKLGLIKCA